MLAQASRRNRRTIGEGRVRLRLGRFDALPFEPESIDKILAVNVVYFFHKDADEIREAMRVLRPGGVNGGLRHPSLDNVRVEICRTRHTLAFR